MFQRSHAAALVLVVAAVAAPAQDAPRFRWQAGQVLDYATEHVTAMAETMGDAKSESKNHVRTTKRWTVSAVDAGGVATLTLSLTALKQDRTTTSGDRLTFDSADVEKSTPELRGMAKFLNKAVATLRVDGYGRVVEVKDSVGPATTYEQELPFLLMLPAALPKTGQSWERTYKITLAPPLGTGEKYDAAQKYTAAEVKGDSLRVTLKTELKNPPKAAADMVPLWQMLPEGELVFDLKAGRLEKAVVGVERELPAKDNEGAVKYTSKLTVTRIEK
jgi:hypothetical protein